MSVDHSLTMLFTEQQNSTVKASVGLHERRPSADYAVHTVKAPVGLQECRPFADYAVHRIADDPLTAVYWQNYRPFKCSLASTEL